MEARAAATSAATPGRAVTEVAATDSVAIEPGRRIRPSGTARGRAVARPFAIDRAQEYRYIRSDLYRLLITASGLLGLMILLLVVIEA